MSNLIALWRIERGLNQWELSSASGIPRWTLQLIERGHRTPTHQECQALTKALAVDQKKLFPKISEAKK